MESGKITVSGVGCALADYLYTKVDFKSPGCKKYLSKTGGGGGISPGKLVFAGELEEYAGKTLNAILADIVGTNAPDAFNLGGPGLVSLIHASQILGKKGYEVKFYGIAGEDGASRRISQALGNLPLNTGNYATTNKYPTPVTYVLSDPGYNNGEGERAFINEIGAAGHYTPEMLGKDFFNSGIVCFGGTALVPQIHDNITMLLQKAKDKGCITVVNTVYDFRSEKNNPGKPWPLGDSKKSFKLIDVLIMDKEESLKISGEGSLAGAVAFFINSGIGSFIITNGVSSVIAYSYKGVFENSKGLIQMPTSAKIKEALKTIPANERDTTGCGDNFAGGIIASLAMQMKEKTTGNFDIREAVSWGIASGGFACCYVGGTYFEKYTGEKLGEVQRLLDNYKTQGTQ